MHRVIHYFNSYNILEKTTQDFLYSHGRIQTFSKGSYYIHNQETKHDWCFLLEGLLGYEVISDTGSALEQLCPTQSYFVGTKHLYSSSAKNTALIFLQTSVVYSISNHNLRLGIAQYPELDHVYHILKQHELNLTAIFLRLPKIAREERLSYLYHSLPEVIGKLTIQQVCSLLGYTNHRQYYKALKYYFENRL